MAVSVVESLHYTRKEIKAAEDRAINAPKGPTGYPMDSSMIDLFRMKRVNNASNRARRKAHAGSH